MILEGEIMDAKMSSFFLHEKLMSLRSTVSTVAQKCHGNFNFTHGNFNLLTAISTLLTAISILLTGISILLTAISIYSRQFRSFTQGNFNFLTATLTAFFASLTICQLRRPTETKSMADKTQNQKWIVKVDLQREKWKSQSIYEPAELGGIYMRLGRTQTGMSSYRSPYISFQAFTDLKMNSDRSDFISVADPTRVTFVPVWDRTVLIPNKKATRSGPINSMLRFFVWLRHFCFLLAKIGALLPITSVNKT